MNQKSFSYISILILLGILLLVNAISRGVFSGASWDLTEDNLYSVSDGTKGILKSLKEPVTLRFYFNRKDATEFPALKLYGDRIQSFLQEYERLSNGKLKVEIYDPLPDTEEEEWAQKYGLTPVNIGDGKRIFLGLAGVNSYGTEESLPVFNLARQEMLEYDVTKLVSSLSREKKPVIAILSPLPLNPQLQDPRMRQQQNWYFIDQIKQFGEVRFLQVTTETIPQDIDLVMAIHPKNLSDGTLYALDQFVLRGGRLFVAVDPYAQVDEPKADPQNPTAALFADRSSNLAKLFATWGLELEQGKAVADRALSTKVNSQQGMPPIDFSLFLSLRQVSGEGKPIINPDDVITAQVDSMLIPWAGSLKVTPKEGITVEPLLMSSLDSMLVEEKNYRFGGGDPDSIRTQFVSGNAQLLLAARIGGTLSTSFPGGLKKEEAPSEADQSMSKVDAHIEKSAKPANVVVISDVDFLSNYYSVSIQNVFGLQVASPLNENLVFVQNVAENLLGSDGLINLRSRGKFSRPFTKVQAIEQQAQERWQSEVSSLEAKLKEANQRLTQLQAGTGGDELMPQNIVTEEYLEEVNKFKEEKVETQRRLREVRRNLRSDIEALGTTLFLLNTFLIPLLLIALSSLCYFRKKRA